jgi:hypothetical protein
MNPRRQPPPRKAPPVPRLRVKAKSAIRPTVAVPVLIAYADIASGRHALSRVTTLVRALHPGAESHPMLWRFHQLDQPRWREMALRDAARARALVLSMPHEDAFCARTEAWLTALLSRLRGTSLTVLALVGETESWTITLAQPKAARPQKAGYQAPDEVFASVAPKRMTACVA